MRWQRQSVQFVGPSQYVSESHWCVNLGSPNPSDIGYTITSMATSSVEACKSPETEREICRKYNKIAEFTKNYPRKIHYTRLDRAIRDKEAIDQIMSSRIISFSDAGFASLLNSYSVEGGFLIMGRAISRDGISHCHGWMIDHRCAKIHRVLLSPLSAETHAEITATDWALWFQVVLIEIFAQKFDVRRTSRPTSFPLRNPFGESPSGNRLKREIDLAGSTFRPRSEGNQKLSQSGARIAKLACPRCQTSIENNWKTNHAKLERSTTLTI